MGDMTSEAAAASLRRMAGTLVALPLVVFALGNEYSCTNNEVPVSARIEPAEGEAARRRPSRIRPQFHPEGTDWASAAVLLPGQRFAVELAGPTAHFHLTLQADCCDDYAVSGRTASGRTIDVGLAPREIGSGLRSRTMAVVLEEAVVALYVTPVSGDGRYSIAAIRVGVVRSVPHWWLPIAAWVAWLALFGASRVRPAFISRTSQRLLRRWELGDPYVASVLIITILLRLTPAVVTVLVVVGLSVLLVIGGRLAFERLSGAALAYNVAILIALVWLVPHLIAYVIEDKVGRKYDLTVDHRLQPDGQEVNADSLRFRGSSESVKPGDFNILFLGDSFTYGFELAYEDAPPYVVERLLGNAGCSRRVRAINFGWVSSSPLLSYRLLRDVGSDYHPDLIVYMLDMTDFHDDLKYAERLARSNGGGWGVERSRAVASLLERAARTVLDRDQLDGAMSVWRRPLAVPSAPSSVPPDIFFATNQPLESSREDIERGVVTNLRAIHVYANELGADMVLVILPRAYQFSDREVPDNWEADAYEVLGPHVLAPFEYFESVADELPFPVLSLLPAFRDATEFPLYKPDDPHWNPAGARLAAGVMADYLRAHGKVPCE